MANGHGGKRANTGAKKGSKWPSTVDKHLALQRFRELAYAELDPLIQAQLQLAKGVFVMLAKTDTGYQEVTDPKVFAMYLKTGHGFLVVQKPPDVRALKDTFDRAMGQAAQVVEMSGKDGDGPIVITHKYAKEAE